MSTVSGKPVVIVLVAVMAAAMVLVVWRLGGVDPEVRRQLLGIIVGGTIVALAGALLRKAWSCWRKEGA
jgi:hypothetical protein